MGMGALSPECGEGSKGTISWGCAGVEMRVWDESMGTKTWGWELFPGILF